LLKPWAEKAAAQVEEVAEVAEALLPKAQELSAMQLTNLQLLLADH
jgi:hypothetical protein